MARSKKKQAAPQHDPDELKRRALAGYWRFAKPGEQLAPPESTRAEVTKVGGLLYVTLTSGTDVLAVFRVRNDGKLKRLVRPPRQLRGGEA
jgi:hypothetical protein